MGPRLTTIRTDRTPISARWLARQAIRTFWILRSKRNTHMTTACRSGPPESIICFSPSPGEALSWQTQVLPFPGLVPGHPFRLYSGNAARPADSWPSLLATGHAGKYRPWPHQRRSQLHPRDPQGADVGTHSPPICRFRCSSSLCQSPINRLWATRQLSRK